MKAEDLRLGNWVDASPMLHGEKNYVQVSRIGRKLITICMGDDDVGDAYEPQIQGIPLTPDILERAGFEKLDSPNTQYWIQFPNGRKDLYKIHIFKTINDQWHLAFSDVVPGEVQTYIPPVHIKHVHELQNLYHSLTGTDLSIDLK